MMKTIVFIFLFSFKTFAATSFKWSVETLNPEGDTKNYQVKTEDEFKIPMGASILWECFLSGIETLSKKEDAIQIEQRFLICVNTFKQSVTSVAVCSKNKSKQAPTIINNPLSLFLAENNKDRKKEIFSIKVICDEK